MPRFTLLSARQADLLWPCHTSPAGSFPDLCLVPDCPAKHDGPATPMLRVLR